DATAHRFAMWILLAAALRLAAVACEQRIENRFPARVVDGERRRHAPLMHLAAHVAAQRVVVTGDDRRGGRLRRLRRAVAIDLLCTFCSRDAGSTWPLGPASFRAGRYSRRT